MDCVCTSTQAEAVMAAPPTAAAAAKPHISSRDPEKLFEILKQIGSGSYGTVQKVSEASGFLVSE